MRADHTTFLFREEIMKRFDEKDKTITVAVVVSLVIESLVPGQGLELGLQ